MGLQVKKNKKGQYQLFSTTSDKRLHKKNWISEYEAKKILIDRAFWDFFRAALEIDLVFPEGYFVDGKRIPHDSDALDKVFKILYKTPQKEVEETWKKLKETYKLDF